MFSAFFRKIKSIFIDWVVHLLAYAACKLVETASGMIKYCKHGVIVISNDGVTIYRPPIKEDTVTKTTSILENSDALGGGYNGKEK